MWDLARIVADKLDAKMPPSYYFHCDIEKTQRLLGQRFEILDGPVFQDSPLHITTDGWPDYSNALDSLKDSMFDRSTGKLANPATVKEIIETEIKAIFDQEVSMTITDEHEGYFTDRVCQAYFVCANTKK